MDRTIELEDTAEGQGEHLVEILWHLHPDITPEFTTKDVVMRSSDKALCRMDIPDGFEAQLEASWYSPEYGRRLPNKRVVFRRCVRLPARIAYTIRIGQ